MFHGLGFAGGLLDAMAELPTTALMSALSAFSLGVEVGHQCVVLPVFVILMLFTKNAGQTRQRMALRSGSALIAAGGAFYLIEAFRV